MRYLCLLFTVSLFTSFAEAQNCAGKSVGTIPLNDQGATMVQNDIGGLYPGGMNQPPQAHFDAAMQLAGQIEPLDTQGRVNQNTGKIGVVSIGLSNTRGKWDAFMTLMDGDATINPQVVLSNGAKGGMDLDELLADPAAYWAHVDRNLQIDNITPAQVQVLWIMHTHRFPDQFGDYVSYLKNQYKLLMPLLVAKFPNVKLAFMTSRSYAGYATGPKNPEPYAFQTGISTRDLIEDQINGDMALNWDGTKGTVNSPLLLWGPYIWADGENARADGMTWLCSDFSTDGTHPNQQGYDKVALKLRDFFSVNAHAKGWFLKNPAPACDDRAVVQPVGSGFAGGQNAPPILMVSDTPEAVDPFTPFQVVVQGTAPNAPGWLIVGTRAGTTLWQGITLHVDFASPFTIYPVMSNSKGEVRLDFGVIDDPAACGNDGVVQYVEKPFAGKVPVASGACTIHVAD